MWKIIKTMSVAVLILTGLLVQAKQVKLSDLNWMAGQWSGFYQGLPTEAYYSTAAGGLILGQTKISNGSKIEFFEFEKIEMSAGGLVLTPMPFGRAGVSFLIKKISDKKLVFENLEHDFPRRIIYELKSTGQLLARIEGTQNGQQVSENFLFNKVK